MLTALHLLWPPFALNVRAGNQNRVYFFIRHPHKGPFNIFVRLMAPRLESQVLTLPVNDEETIRLVSTLWHAARRHMSPAIGLVAVRELRWIAASSKAQSSFSVP